jgi:hypothetical protein
MTCISKIRSPQILHLDANSAPILHYLQILKNLNVAKTSEKIHIVSRKSTKKLLMPIRNSFQ